MLDHSLVSRHHARLDGSGGRYTLTDLGSANGTSLGGRELDPRQPFPLKDGDSITIGPFTLVFRLAEEETQAAPGVRPPITTAAGPPLAQTVTSTQQPAVLVTTPGGTQEYPLLSDTVTIGRDSACDIVIDEPVVSRRHAELRRRGAGYELVDGGSRNGLTVNGKAISTMPLHDGDVAWIADSVSLAYRMAAAGPAPGTIVARVELGERTQVTIGRDEANDVTLEHPSVSRRHARILRTDTGGQAIEDLGSSSGTFVNGERLEPGALHILQPSDMVRIGPVRFDFQAGQIQQMDESRDLRLDGVHLNQYVSVHLNLLQDISLSIHPREFVAVVGASGAGKSTLLDALNGFRPARAGQVLVNGTSLYDNFDSYRTDLGYVPQDDIIHKELPIARALDYSAQLRLPPDTTRDERRQRVEDVMETLGLTERRDLPIVRLSGGQRKRVSIGAELLTQPGLFFLDEATSGLDPGTESQMMRLLRKLADDGHTVVLVTHATKNVMLCDQVVFMARGGHLAYFGPPEESLTYFGVEDFDGIYEKLESELEPETWGQKYRSSPQYAEYVKRRLTHAYPQFSDAPDAATYSVTATAGAATAAAAQPARRASTLSQFRILSARYLDIIRRDRTNIILLLAIAPALGLIDLIAWNRPILEPVAGDSVRAMTMLFMAALIPFLVGALSSVREIVKEAPIYKRERAVSLKVFPYLLSKVWVGFLFAFYHAAALFAVKMVAVDLSGLSTLDLAQFYGTLALAAMSGVMWGLVISAFVSREEQAMLLVIVVVVIQIVFSGGLLPLSQLGAGGDILGGVTSTKWSLQALSASAHVQTGDCDAPTLANCNLPGLAAYTTEAEKRVAFQPIDDRFGEVFGANVYSTWAAMAIIMGALFVVIIFLQKRKDLI